MTRLVELGCRLRDDGMIGREASLVKSDLGDFEPIGWSGSNSWDPVVQVSCEKNWLSVLWSCGREARECGQAVVNARLARYPRAVHTARRAWTGPKDSSTTPQDGSAS